VRIDRLQVHVVEVPPPHVGGMYWIFVQLSTACGLQGVGEVYAASFHPRVMEAAIEDVYQRCLHGHDPHQVERLFRSAYSSGFTQRPDLSVMGVLSGLEMACWDIIGKAAGQPVYQLLGGRVHERLRSYTYLYPQDAQGHTNYDDVELAVECALGYVERGFTAVKFDPAGPYTIHGGHHLSLAQMDHCETFCRRLREVLGSRADLLVGTHGQMTPASAIRLARRLEPYEPLWFEEPVPPGQNDALAEVARQTAIPIAVGERLTTKYEFLDVMQRKAASILQMNLGRVGGLMEAKKIAAIAEAHYLQIAPHLYNGPVGAAASVQLATASPNFLIQESMLDWSGFYADILEEPIRWERGFIVPPTTPGLGVALNMDVVRAHSPYRGERLHLLMDPKPYDVAADDAAWRQRWNHDKAL
jgi:galactonate dehydratase